jgi:hypothetical protein
MLTQPIEASHNGSHISLVTREPSGVSSFCGPSSSRDDLTDDILIHILQLLAADFNPEIQKAWPQAAGRQFAWFRRSLPLVCKRWNSILSLGGKFSWSSLVVSAESEMPRRRRPDIASSAHSGGGCAMAAGSPTCFAGAVAAGTAALPGSSPPTISPGLLFTRPCLGALPKLRSRAVVRWAEERSGGLQHLLLDLAAASHDFDGSRPLEALLRAANRGPRGLLTLRLIWPDGESGRQSGGRWGRPGLELCVKVQQ